VDPGTIRSGGGAYEPRLIIPVSIGMHTRPAEEMLALLQLRAQLHDGAINSLNTKIGAPVTVNLIDGMRCRSLPTGQYEDRIELDFLLTAASVSRLEAARRQTAPGGQFMHLSLQGTAAWLGQTHGQSGEVSNPNPLETTLGLHSPLSVFWTSGIDALSIGVDPTVWVSNVLPGLGVNRVRLVEVQLPPTLPDGTAASKWDEANDAYHLQKYDDCIAHCRSVIRSWNKDLGATKQNHLAAVVAERSGWTDDDPRRGLLDAVWQGLIDVANAPHHDEDQPEPFVATAADAQFHLLMTAVASDYVARLTGKASS
jgi:hypothetical protein